MAVTSASLGTVRQGKDEDTRREEMPRREMDNLNRRQTKGSNPRRREVGFNDEMWDGPEHYSSWLGGGTDEREEHRKEIMEMMRSQTEALKATALHGAKATATAQQATTKNEMEWADQRRKHLVVNAKKYIDKIQSENSKFPPKSQQVGDAFLKIWDLVYEDTKPAAMWIPNLYPS